MFLFLVFSLLDLTFQSAQEYRLIQDLKENYNVIERPVKNHSEAIAVKLRVLLQQIVDVDEKNQALTLVVWTQMTWQDYKLKWKTHEYGNISDIQIPKKFIWMPDVLLFNSVNENFDASFPVNAVVSHLGTVYIAPPGIVKISCELTMTWFPFDEQICFLKYGSWTYAGSKLDLNIDDSDLEGDNQIDMTYFIASEEFEILETMANKTVKEFNGETYIELYFHVHIRRRSLYYVLNWVLPAVLISMSNIIQFMMPTAGGEKITLQTTNILAVLIFLSQTSKATPPTSESIPVIAAFFSASLCIMGASTMATVLIMNVHFRSSALREMGPWTKYVFLDVLPRVLLMKHHCDQEKTNDLILTADETPSKTELMEDASTRMKNINTLARALRPRLSTNVEDLAVYSNLEQGVMEITEILEWFEERFISSREDMKNEEDWKVMALVLDRTCLVLYFTLVFIIASCITVFPKK